MVFHHPAAVGGSQLYQPATSAWVGLGVGDNCGEVHFGWLISGQFDEEEVWKKAQKKVEELK